MVRIPFRSVRWVFLSLLALCMAASAQSGSGTKTGGGSTPTTTTTTPRPTTTQPPARQPQMQRPVFVTGTVMMADGSPVPRGVEIQRVCSGRSRREGYADSTGHFSFQLGQDLSVQDATSDDLDGRFPGGAPSGGINGAAGIGMPSIGGGPNLLGCELRASAAGFRSSKLDLSQMHTLDSPDVGTIVLERIERVAGTVTSATSYAASKDAQKAFKKGQDEAKKGKFGEAQAHFEEAARLYPRYAEAWAELGMMLNRQNQGAAAKNAFNQALQADPKFVTPYIQLAGMAALTQDWAETAKMSDQAITLDPIDFPGSYFFNAVANFNLGHYDVAETSARKALRLDPQHHLSQIPLLLGRILMLKHDYPGAMENLRAYLDRSPNAPDAPEIRRQIETLQQASAAHPAGSAATPAAAAASVPTPPKQ